MKLHYFRSLNFGDALSPLLVEKLTGKAVTYADATEADLVAVGSVFYSGHWLYRNGRYAHTVRGFLSYLKAKSKCRIQPITVWGTGFLQDEQDVAPVFRLRKANIVAVRGKVTLAILKRLKLTVTGGGLGDPGLLYPMLLESMPMKKHEVGIVPHYMDADAGAAVVESLRRNGCDACLVDVMNPDPVETLRKIAECETVVSSSLHGCIVSDGMRIPNHQISFSTLGYSKEDYLLKYRDYYSALDMALPDVWTAEDLHGDGLANRIRSAYGVSNEKVEEVKDGLVKALHP